MSRHRNRGNRHPRLPSPNQANPANPANEAPQQPHQDDFEWNRTIQGLYREQDTPEATPDNVPEASALQPASDFDLLAMLAAPLERATEQPEQPEPEPEQEQEPPQQDTDEGQDDNDNDNDDQSQPRYQQQPRQGPGRPRRQTRVAFDIDSALTVFIKYLVQLREDASAKANAEDLENWRKLPVGNRGPKPTPIPAELNKFAFDREFVQRSLDHLTGDTVDLTADLGAKLLAAATEAGQLIVAVDSHAPYFVLLDRPVLENEVWWLNEQDLPENQTTSIKKMTARLTPLEEAMVTASAARLSTDASTVMREGANLLAELAKATGATNIDDLRAMVDDMMRNYQPKR
jgi:hypothetical protein